MLVSKMESIAKQIQDVKSAMVAAIKSKTPVDSGENGVLFTTIKSSELERNIWCPVYYMTGRQLRYVVEYIEGKSERSLETIANTLRDVVENGKSQAFSGVLFNDTARKIIAGVL